MKRDRLIVRLQALKEEYDGVNEECLGLMDKNIALKNSIDELMSQVRVGSLRCKNDL